VHVFIFAAFFIVQKDKQRLLRVCLFRLCPSCF